MKKQQQVTHCAPLASAKENYQMEDITTSTLLDRSNPLLLARVLGLAPINDVDGKLQPSTMRYRYSVGLFGTALVGNVLTFTIQHWGLFSKSVLEMGNALCSSLLLAAMTLKFSAVVKNKFTSLLSFMQDVLTNDQVSRVTNIQMLACMMPVVDVILGLVCREIAENKFSRDFLLTLVWTAGELIMSAEISLLMYLLTVVANMFDNVNISLDRLEDSKVAGTNIAYEVEQVREQHKTAVDYAEAVCEYFGPPVAITIIYKCFRAVFASYMIGPQVVGVLLPDVTPLTYVWAVAATTELMSKIAMLIVLLVMIHRPIDKGSSAIPSIHTLWNFYPLMKRESLELELFGDQLAQRPVGVALSGFMSLDLTALLGSAVALANYNVLILQLKDLKISDVKVSKHNTYEGYDF